MNDNKKYLRLIFEIISINDYINIFKYIGLLKV